MRSAEQGARRHGRRMVALAWVLALAGAGAAHGASWHQAAKPANDTPPTVTGDAVVGERLTANPGTWNGSAPISYQYQWLSCGQQGENCGPIAGATTNSYKIASGDAGNTIRVKVIASNAQGSGNAQSAATAKVTTAASTTTTTPAPAPNGCPPGKGNVSVTDMSLPARLLIDSVTSPTTLGSSTQSLIVNVHVTNTCGQTVRGALVYVTATPYNQFSIPTEAPTNSNGDASLTMTRLAGYPVSSKQQLLALFVRARKDGEDILAGVSVRRLVSLPVKLG